MTTPALTRESQVYEFLSHVLSDEDAKIHARLIEEIYAALRDAEVEALRGRFTAPVVCMCGSVRFRSTWAAQMARLTDEGRIVLTVGRMLPKASGEFDPAHKARLDWLHKRKIDLADSVFVLDVGGYIGDSTRSEIAYAESIGRSISYLSREFPDYVEPEDELTSLRAQVHVLTEERDAARKNADFLRESVGECHLLISRDTAEFQLHHDWESTSLPWRVADVILKRASLRARVETAERERDEARAFIGRVAFYGEALIHREYEAMSSTVIALVNRARQLAPTEAPTDG